MTYASIDSYFPPPSFIFKLQPPRSHNLKVSFHKAALTPAQTWQQELATISLLNHRQESSYVLALAVVEVSGLTQTRQKTTAPPPASKEKMAIRTDPLQMNTSYINLLFNLFS